MSRAPHASSPRWGRAGPHSVACCCSLVWCAWQQAGMVRRPSSSFEQALTTVSEHAKTPGTAAALAALLRDMHPLPPGSTSSPSLQSHLQPPFSHFHFSRLCGPSSHLATSHTFHFSHLSYVSHYWSHWQVKEDFVTDREDLTKRNIMDGDPFISSSPSWRFKAPETEPYMPSQAPGNGARSIDSTRGEFAGLCALDVGL